jgi:hypothetical protein
VLLQMFLSASCIRRAGMATSMNFEQARRFLGALQSSKTVDVIGRETQNVEQASSCPRFINIIDLW